MIDTVIFDLGGTLLRDDTPDMEAGMRRLHEAAGGNQHPSAEEFLEAFQALWKEMLPSRDKNDLELHAWSIMRLLFEMVGMRPNLSMLELEREFFDAAIHFKIESGAIETLSALKDRGCKVGLLSNTLFSEEVLHEQLEHFGMRRFFDSYVISSAYGIRKPNPAIFKVALQHLHSQPEQSLYIGDTPRFDIAGANRSGMVSVWYNPKGEEEPASPKPQHVIGRLEDIMYLLELLNQSD
jgi:HAD superfamily hydrolase (TIGR01549 family)